jgi:hypothetical protein
MNRFPIIILLFGSCVTYGQLFNGIQKYQSQYLKKCERISFKYLDMHEVQCYKSKKEIRKHEITFLPIYQVKNTKSTPDINNFLEHLKILKRSKPMLFALRNGEYFGRLESTRLHNPWKDRFEIYCGNEIDMSTHERTIKELELILEFQPDALLNISNYRFPLVLIKNDKFFFTMFFNGTELKLISPDDWVSDFELKTNKSWTVLSF